MTLDLASFNLEYLPLIHIVLLVLVGVKATVWAEVEPFLVIYAKI